MSNTNLPIILRILDNENRLVERADQKSISLLSILGVFMVFFVVYYRIIPINILTAALIILYFLFALMSILSLIMAIRPRIRKEPDDPKAKDNSLTCDPAFFTGICSFPNVGVYKESLQEVLKDETNIADIYIRQIFSVARINSVKYKHIQRGVLLVIMALVIELIIIAYLFIFHLGAGEMPPIT